MGDLKVMQQYAITPPPEVEQMWINVKIQEKKSTIAGIKQLIEDLKKGKILDLEARVIMNEKELEMLIQSKRGDGGVIDV